MPKLPPRSSSPFIIMQVTLEFFPRIIQANLMHNQHDHEAPIRSPVRGRTGLFKVVRSADKRSLARPTTPPSVDFLLSPQFLRDQQASTGTLASQAWYLKLHVLPV